jgi:hypothetical protein
MRNLTVGMTPSFFFEGDFLFKAQLKCLSEQKYKDFDVYAIDPHYSKRKDLVPQYANQYKLNIVHIPYMPNTHIAKRLDCAIFNAPYMYSESNRIVRLSCWRFVTPDFTDICAESKSNCDFYFHNCSPKNQNDIHPDTGHSISIWNMNSDNVNWCSIPKINESGCSWTEHSEANEKEQLMPLNCYGNYMIFRNEWLEINGCDEVFTNNEHWEDQDFCLRARKFGSRCARFSKKMFRLHHYYGSHSGRSNIVPDHVFKKPCEACDRAQYTYEPNRFDIKNRIKNGEIEIFEEDQIWVCKKCHLSSTIWHKEVYESYKFIENKSSYKSNIISKYKIGRNLQILAEDMRGKTIQEKVEIYNDSWTNGRYYVK